ncbi:MAG TPA: hypothetical protein VN181_16610 [Thermoanaerobaculia bacterium]|nr:hypothetical protein [Thermoanaerobaculia bacterium]
MRKLFAALTLTLTLAAAAPAYSAPRFMRDGDPIVRVIKFMKRVFGITTHNEITIPIPSPSTTP